VAAAPTSQPAAAAVRAGSLTIAQPWARATPGGARVAGGYLTVTNTGAVPDRLIGGSAAFAERVEIHEMATRDGVMTMRALPAGLTIAPGQTVALKPGGLHVMFMELRTPLAEGQTVKVTLDFEKAGKVSLDFRIGSLGGRAAPGGEHHHH
ncbi:copper chaperone PCu(A)C, partial [Phreatobacter sp.]|uniref:copper chaperone PCu(A)C n=1 Tax=Phreatobacter sp. TaxID=1966341 RepID=UPI0025E8D211